MVNRRALSLVGVLVAATCGCRAVRNVRVDAGRPVTITPEEAQKLRVDGMALYAQQPRGLVSVGKAAERLEQAARTLRDNYDAQWQAAQALAFLAENETQLGTATAGSSSGSRIGTTGAHLETGWRRGTLLVRD